MRAERRGITRVPLQSNEGNFLHKISHAEGARRMGVGTAMAIYDHRYGRNEIVGYRVTAAAKTSNSQATMPVITTSEVFANVGLFGRSRTVNLPEYDTKLRDSKQARVEARDPEMPPEDFIELSQDKIHMWKRIPLMNPQRVAWAAGA